MGLFGSIKRKKELIEAKKVISILQMLLSAHEDSLRDYANQHDEFVDISYDENIAYAVLYYRLLSQFGRQPLRTARLYDIYTDTLTYGFSKEEALDLFSQYDKIYDQCISSDVTQIVFSFIPKAEAFAYGTTPPEYVIDANVKAAARVFRVISGEDPYDPGYMNTPISLY